MIQNSHDPIHVKNNENMQQKSKIGYAAAIGAACLFVTLQLLSCSEDSVSPVTDEGGDCPTPPHVDKSEDPGPTEDLVGGATKPNLLIAFTGDQGTGTSARRVCELIRDAGADAYIISGDLGYGGGFGGWCAMIDDIFPSDFPVFGAIGNHDDHEWPGYQDWLITRAKGEWSGDYGVDSRHLLCGLFFVLSGAGTMGDNAMHAEYVRESFAQSEQIWNVLSMHQQMKAMQVGGKGDATGWPIYEYARERGALVITAHEHSYHRTHVLSEMATQTVADATSPYTITPGQTLTAVSGLGGASIRNQDRCLPTTPPYGCNGEWASIYTSDQGATHGVLFIEFHVDGDPHKAHGWFQNVDGAIIDDFILVAE
jgi:hypothetical protein